MNKICKKLWSRLTDQERKDIYRNHETKKDISVKLGMPSNFSLIEAARLTRLAVGESEETQMALLQLVDGKENRFVMIAAPHELEHLHAAFGEVLKDMEILKAKKTLPDDLNKNTPIN